MKQVQSVRTYILLKSFGGNALQLMESLNIMRLLMHNDRQRLYRKCKRLQRELHKERNISAWAREAGKVYHLREQPDQVAWHGEATWRVQALHFQKLYYREKMKNEMLKRDRRHI